MSLIDNLQDSPEQLARSSKFTVLNGFVYLTAGGLLMAWPGAVQAVLFGPSFVGREAALIRVLGMTVAIIGWFYVFGGRSGGKQVVAASVLDRVVLVPLVLIPTAMAGVFPTLLGTFAVLDPILGLIAWYLLAQENRESRPHSGRSSAN